MWLGYAIALVAGYLLGSLPTGFLVARSRGIDLRTVGSGNIGATNAMRVLGKGPGLFVLLVDAAKGAVACLVGPWLAGLVGGDAGADWPRIAAGVGAILGHNFTCWLRFKGGKGVATSAGVLLVLMPAALGICLAMWLAVVAASRIVSLASIAAAITLPVAVWALDRSGPLQGVALALAVLAIHRHRSNIARLLRGEEPRIGQGRAKAKEQASS
ncbi:MAG: glycerol-3-phosphate 1-O-acyltransferase [Verrucomicrobia bacterium]|nr:MAG: glycerol-3-phosphate 1-O-acyltransferase [Verrucomicrobiota bacterium]